ncbi:ABC transporter substrate-binding protein [Desmospora activa]|uniref:ABC transporter substrate-binding protein n=1 Tax=Desmospora activa TaxID=500615 RepID=UPI003CCBB108
MSLLNRVQMICSLMAVLVLVGTVMAGCATGQGDSANTITLWHGMTDTGKETFEQLAAQFEEKHPDFKVNVVYIAQQGEGRNEKLLAAIAGGNPPDVAFFDRFEVGSWANQGSLTDLTAMVEESDLDLEGYYPFAVEEASYKGKLYALPMGTDARMLFYNKDHFREAGIDSPPKTIAELEAAAEKLTIKKGKRFERIGFIPWLGQGWTYTWGWSFGGDFYDKDKEKVTIESEVVQSLEWMRDYAKKYNIEDVTAFTDSTGSAASDPFLTGQISMIVDVNAKISVINKYKPDLNYDVAPIPTPTGNDFTTWSGGWSLIMPKGAKNQEAAWEFMKFVAGEEGQKNYSKNTYNLSAIDSINQELYEEDPIMKQFVDLLPSSNHRPVISEGTLLWNELNKARDLAVRGKGDPRQLMQKVSNKVNKELEQ